MNPLSDVYPQQYAFQAPAAYFQALELKDIIEKAIRYNKTSVNVDLEGELAQENILILQSHGFHVEKWHKGYFISWNH